MTEKTKGRLSVYAAGGAGINIGKAFEPWRDTNEVGVAEVKLTYIDTSRSNLTRDLPEDACYLIQGLDGSGKIRKENYEEISARVRDVLQRHPPMDLSVVISSASGGSGSVIAPSIVSELLERGSPVVVITVGATDTRLDIDNTLKTIKSYESIAKLRKAPVVMAYFQNSKETPRAKVDSEVAQLVLSLMAVYSRENHELDSQDLFNFLRFDRATTFQPQLASLQVFFNDVPASEAENVISVASLAMPGKDVSLNFTPDYQCTGYLSADIAKDIAEKTPIHLVTSSNLFGVVAKELNTRLDVLQQAQRARVVGGKILTDDDSATDNGLVL